MRTSLVKSKCYFNNLLINIKMSKSFSTKPYSSSFPGVDYSFANAKRDDVKYKLFTKAEENGTSVDIDSISKADIDKTRPMKVFIHGWNSTGTSQWYAPLRNAYFSIRPHNIIYVDWSIAGSEKFKVSSANTKPVGGYIGDLIIASGISLENIHIIGHSLGSHVAGFAGKHILTKTGNKIARITATDPAAPCFEHPSMEDSSRLSQDDALFVDVIHTDIGLFGFMKPMGHVDFYPNGGREQPGCPPQDKDMEIYCSHRKSSAYLIKSVYERDIQAFECKTLDELKTGGDAFGNKIVFGDGTNPNARGIYYVKIEANLDNHL